MQKPTPKSAFTLIELLVVISIIALLIGILLPALGAARSTARISASSSNQRQIGIAMAAYRADNDSFFPMWQDDPGAPTWFWTTRLAVDDYIPGMDIYTDPAFVGAETPYLDEGGVGLSASKEITRVNMDDRRWNRIHYGYNFVHVGANIHQLGVRSLATAGNVQPSNPRAGGPSDKPARIEDMQDATSVLVTTGVRDFIINGSDPAFDDGTAPAGDKIWGAHVVLDVPVFDAVGNAGAPHARYNDAVQIMWADGHVSAIKMPFTQEEQDEGAGGSVGSEVLLVYGDDALGDVSKFGGATLGATGGPNYFDITSSKPSGF